MKKLAIILAFLMLIPGAAFGLEMMNDSAMDDVTGQAGVSIIADDIQLFMNIDRMAWLDSDGFEGDDAFSVGNPYAADATGSGGAVGISNFQLDVLEINAIVNTTNTEGTSGTRNLNLGSTTAGNLELNWDYGQTTAFDSASIDSSYGLVANTQTKGLDNYNSDANKQSTMGNDFQSAAITIDATAELPATSEAFQNMTGQDTINVGGVMIGLPTMEIYIPSMSLTPAFYNLEGVAAENQAVNDVDGLTSAGLDPADYGTVEITGITFSVLSGWVEIAPH